MVSPLLLVGYGPGGRAFDENGATQEVRVTGETASQTNGDASPARNIGADVIMLRQWRSGSGLKDAR